MALKRILTLILATVALAFAVSTTSYGATPPTQDDPAPDFAGLTLDGEPVSLNKYLGKTVVISFWATWCPYCQKELPILNRIQAVGKGSVQVIAINTEERDVFRKVTKVLKALDIQLTYDPDEKAQEAYGVQGLPHLVVIGRDGKIVSTFRGYDESMLPTIAEAINYANAASK